MAGIPSDPAIATFSHPPSSPESAVLLAKFLDTIAAIESKRGENNVPRFEPAYMPKGFIITVQGRQLIGTGAVFNDVVEKRWKAFAPNSICTAASYGSWQIMYHTAADRGFTGHPCELWIDANSRPWVVKEVDRLWKELSRKGSASVLRIARAWNGGLGGADAKYTEGYGEKFAAAWKAVT
jgi:hypothetical protein